MNKTLMVGAGVLAGLGIARAARHSSYDFNGATVLISGGSRGLGLLLAREFAERGARLAITARDRDELDRAEQQLRQTTPDILTIEADMTVEEQAQAAVRSTRKRFGPVDVLVNNAGTISVSPMEETNSDDYRESLNIHFWAPYFATTAVLPDMRSRRTGRIVNISSIGGKISVPHLLPYSVGKFALTGFSEGLRSELAKDGISVTTVCPGLMRTGSPRNAFFKGKNQAEYAWFSISASQPFISINAERAARTIVEACRRGRGEVILSIPAKMAALFHGVCPGTTADILGLVNRLLPAPGGVGQEKRTGAQSYSKASPSILTTLNERAAARNNEVA